MIYREDINDKSSKKIMQDISLIETDITRQFYYLLSLASKRPRSVLDPS